jgi:hypothetical protein
MNCTNVFGTRIKHFIIGNTILGNTLRIFIGSIIFLLSQKKLGWPSLCCKSRQQTGIAEGGHPFIARN